MVQESIVEYINSQMKLGVSRDAIKTTLTGAGWQAADVEDTLKKVESAKTSQPAIVAKPVMPTGATSNPPPQTIKVSDLVSSAPISGVSAIKSSAPASKSPLTGASSLPSSVAAKPAGGKMPDTFTAGPLPGSKPHGSHGALITEIVLVVVILAVAGFAGFLFMQNNSLNAQLTTLNGQSSGVNSQLSALQAQVAASTTALTAQVSTLDAANQELQTELSFFVVSTSTTPGATSTATISGTVAAGKTSYVITAMYGAKIYVANSKSASVIAALTPLMGTPAATSTTTTSSSTTATSTTPVAAVAPTVAQFTGTYVPGSDSITLTAVNGTSL